MLLDLILYQFINKLAFILLNLVNFNKLNK